VRFAFKIMNIENAFEKYKELINRYEKSVKQDTNRYFDVEEIEALVDYYLRMGEVSKADHALALGLKIHPINDNLRIQKAKIFLAQQRYEKALQIVNAIAVLDADTLFLRGEVLLNLGKEQEALTIFDDLVNSQDDDPELFADIAALFNQQQYYKTAFSFLKKGVEVYPDNIHLAMKLALSYQNQDMPEQALTMYNRVLDLDPYCAMAWFYVGLIYFDKENYNKALEAFDFAIAINDTDYLSWLQKGHCHFYKDELEAAKAAYRVYLDHNATDGIVWCFYAECYEDTDVQTALDYFLKSISLNESYVDAWLGVGMCQLNLDQPEKAWHYFKQALKLEPESAETYKYIGDAFKDQELFDDALEMYCNAIKFDANDARIWKEIGDIYLQESVFSQAIYFYENAFRLDNQQERLPLFMAMCYYKLGKMELMFKYLNLAESVEADARQVFLNIFPETIEIFNNRKQNK
jgi:tetratricopeptide (TPR) repeat protein